MDGLDALAVDLDLDAAQELQPQARRRDDEVRLELLPGPEADARLGERVDVVGDHRRASLPDRVEEIAVGHEAEALVPRLVRRREVRSDVDAAADGPLAPAPR